MDSTPLPRGVEACGRDCGARGTVTDGCDRGTVKAAGPRGNAAWGRDCGGLKRGGCCGTVGVGKAREKFAGAPWLFRGMAICGTDLCGVLKEFAVAAREPLGIHG